MKRILTRSIVTAAMLILAACAHNNQNLTVDYVLGAATDKNIALHSVRPVELPNSKGLTGQSGERAVAAIDRLNTGTQPELSDVSASRIGSSANN